MAKKKTVKKKTVKKKTVKKKTDDMRGVSREIRDGARRLADAGAHALNASQKGDAILVRVTDLQRQLEKLIDAIEKPVVPPVAPLVSSLANDLKLLKSQHVALVDDVVNLSR